MSAGDASFEMACSGKRITAPAALAPGAIDVINEDIEAVFGDAEVKRDTFAGLANVMSRNVILATNTSCLDPRDIFRGIENQSRSVRPHFFLPAHIVKLLKVVKLRETSKDTLATVYGLAMGPFEAQDMGGLQNAEANRRKQDANRPT